MRGRFWVALVAGLWASGVAAEVYRWVDENGELQFGDQPPAETERERLEIRTAPVSAAQASGDGDSESGQTADATRCDEAVATLMGDIQWYKGWVLEGDNSGVPPGQVDAAVNRFGRYESLGGAKLGQMCRRYWEQAGAAFASCSEEGNNRNLRVECASHLDPVLTERYLSAP